MKKNEYAKGSTFACEGTPVKVVADDPTLEDNCANCFFLDRPVCNHYPCNYEDRQDNSDVHFEKA